MRQIKILNRESLQSLEFGEDCLRMSAIIMPLENQRVKDTNGDTVIINKKIGTEMVENYNKKRRGLFSIGKVKNAPICVEHHQQLNGVVGTLIGDLRLTEVVIDGKMVLSVVGDMMITDDFVIESLKRERRDSPFAAVSVGYNLDKKNLVEVSLVQTPALSNALVLSGNSSLDDSRKEQILKLSNLIDTMEGEVEEIKDAMFELKRKEKLKDRAATILMSAFSQNKINKVTMDNILDKGIEDERELVLLRSVMSELPKTNLNLVSNLKI